MDFATLFFKLSLLGVSITVQNFSTVPIFKVEKKKKILPPPPPPASLQRAKLVHFYTFSGNFF